MTDVVTTLVDLASYVTRGRLLRAINQADRLDLIDAHTLRRAIEPYVRRPGLVRLRALLDEQGSAFADSLLELRFLRLVRAAGLPEPESQVQVNEFRVDFFWPTLGLVVETDGPRDHRTPAQQGSDRRRDQTHAAAGMTAIRFTRSAGALRTGSGAGDPDRRRRPASGWLAAGDEQVVEELGR